MKNIKNIAYTLWRLFFAILLAACIVLGVAPVIPKRKEQFLTEAKAEQAQKNDEKNFELKDYQEKN